jgi:predicted RNA-binding protein with RPS1 domain
MAAISDDDGNTWYAKTLYTASVKAQEGCWEPVAMQLPDGEIQLYFANEFPYKTTSEQEISMMHSKDNAESWGKAEKISFSAGSRDGMPVPIYLPHSKEIAVAIEDNGIRGRFKPVIVRSAKNWQDAPVLRSDLMDLSDLKEGMELTGTVRNVIDFGVFVDIGVHQDGLVHVSEISDRFIKHPSEALSVGEVVKVKVIGVDTAKKRISLSIKQASGYKSEQPQTTEKRPENRNNNTNRDNRNNNANRNNNGNRNNGNRDNRQNRDNRSMDDMLKALQSKFNKR